MSLGLACCRDRVPFCKKHLAKEGGGLIFEVGVFFCETILYVTFVRGGSIVRVHHSDSMV